MTLDEALAEIELAPGADADTIRRAYLRKLKTRSPETDPAGFRRLREAFELLRNPPEAAGVAPGPTPLESASAHLEDLGRKLDATPTAEARVEVLRQAIAEHPHFAPLRWMLLEELVALGWEQEMVALLRTSAQEGLPGFFDCLVRTFPLALLPEELARLEKSEDPAALALCATVWLARDDAGHAVEIMLRALETADARGQAIHPPLDVIQLILGLHARDLPAEAARVRERFAQHLRTTARELDLLDAHAAALWQIAQEIPRLPPRFPPTVRTAIARAVHGGALETALPSLQDIVKNDPDAGWRMAADLKELPALRELYHRAVLAALPARRGHEAVDRFAGSPETRDNREILRLLGQLVAAFVLVGGLGYLLAPKPKPPIPFLASVDAAVEAACRVRKAPTLAEADLCEVVRNMAVHLGQGRCDEVRADQAELLQAQAQVLKQETGGDLAQAPELDGVVSRLFAESRRVCSSL